jgi:hypothetical protein
MRCRSPAGRSRGQARRVCDRQSCRGHACGRTCPPAHPTGHRPAGGSPAAQCRATPPRPRPGVPPPPGRATLRHRPPLRQTDSHAHLAARIRDRRTRPDAACRSEHEALEVVGLSRQKPPRAGLVGGHHRRHGSGRDGSATTRRSLRTTRSRARWHGTSARSLREASVSSDTCADVRARASRLDHWHNSRIRSTRILREGLSRSDKRARVPRRCERPRVVRSGRLRRPSREGRVSRQAGVASVPADCRRVFCSGQPVRARRAATCTRSARRPTAIPRRQRPVRA